MKYFCIVCVSLFLLCPTLAFSVDKLKVSQGNIYIELPVGWCVQSVKNNPSLILMCYSENEQNDKFRESVSITAGTLKDGIDADQYISDLKKSLLSYMSNYKVEENGISYMLVTGTINNVTVKEYYKFIKKKKTIYCITAAAQPEDYSQWEKTFSKIIKSIKIK